MSKTISKALLLVLTATFAAVSASADTFVVNITYNDGAVGSGIFTSSSPFTSIDTWNFSVSGSPTASHNFTSSTASGSAIYQLAPTNGCGTDAAELTFANAGFTSYATVCLTTALSASGATLDLPSTFSCDGTCGVAVSGSIVPARALISYAANLTAGDSVINLTNAGSVNGFDPAGDICANVYVFAEDQQLIACCTCPLTPNHLKTLSAQNDLINNTLTPGVPIGITTLLVASTGACDAATPGPLAAGLKAWGTTLHAAPGGGFAVTETAFQEVQLSDTELTKLRQYCGFIQADGTTYGICGSCKAGAAGAKKQ